MEKKKSKGIKGQARVGKDIIDYSFWENCFGESLRAWDEGFETLGEKFRFRGWNNTFLAEDRRSHSGFSFARIGIVIEALHCRRHFVCRLSKKGPLLLGTSWHFGHFFQLDASIISCCVLSIGYELKLPQIVVVLCWSVGFLLWFLWIEFFLRAGLISH